MITLTVEARDVKVNPKMIRKNGNIPAVYYGAAHKATPITVNKIAFVKAYQAAGESAIITLKTPTGTIDALIHDVALDPVIGDAIHADFYIVAKDHKIEVDIPVEFVGSAPAEKLGGIVMRLMHEIRVESLPGKLPQHFVVDLSKLVAMDSHVTVADIPMPEGVRAMVAGTEVVAGMTGQQEEETEAPSAIDMSSIEVAKKGKKEEEEEVAE
jgi:large subunit ribosomal protein L25